MITRTHAKALALVNWKGVFFDRYLLDRHVTALEGINGAGKTTVMIAAYVVLMPDMSRLTFTNLGETGATGGDRGIWGRLGEAGRPSYAALELVTPEEPRLIAGVHLERKGEPSVEPTPFVITGLGAEVRLQDLLLLTQGADDVVPELTELRENVARWGGRLKVFATAREYFVALYDHGVNALRLSTDEERGKFNEMLRTSMTGGMSRKLTTEVRNFLLRGETGLAATLQRMRANFDECRRTRQEVQEAQRLEREIGEVYETGSAMFATACQAAQVRAAERQQRLARAEADAAQATQAVQHAQDACTANASAVQQAEERHTAQSAASTRTAQRAQQLEQALHQAQEVAHWRTQVASTQAVVQHAAAEQAARGAAKGQARATQQRRQDDYHAATAGLANLQSGLDRLHRHAAAYRQVRGKQREAQQLLALATQPTAGLAALLAAARERLRQADQIRGALQTRRADAERHVAEHAAVLDALTALAGMPIAPETAHAAAGEHLAHFHDQVRQAARAAEWARELAEAGRQASRQADARARAAALGLSVTGPAAASTVIQAQMQREDAHLQLLLDQEQAARAAAAECRRQVEAGRARREQLAARAPVWRELDARATRLAEYLGGPLSVSAAAVQTARARVASDLAHSRAQEQTLTAERERVLTEARQLLAIGGPFTPELLQLRDALGAELLAGAFEDAAPEQAAWHEARLGPLLQALVVDDVAAALHQVHDRADTLPEVWLVSRDADAAQLELEAARVILDGDVVVPEGRALRVARLPTHPRLGRAAREKRAAELRVSAEALQPEIDRARAARRQHEQLVADGEALLAAQALWLDGDPTAELGALHDQLALTTAQEIQQQQAAEQYRAQQEQLAPRGQALRELLGQALLLDPPDWEERRQALAGACAAADIAQDFVTRLAPQARLVEDQRAVLRDRPLSATERTALDAQLQQLTGQRVQLEAGIEALTYVAEHDEALAWQDAPDQLAAEAALQPGLAQQQQQAEQAYRQAEADYERVEAEYEAAHTAWQQAHGAWITADTQRQAAEERFARFGIPHPTQAALDEARAEDERLRAALRELTAQLAQLREAKGRLQGELSQAEQRQILLREAVTREQSAGAPDLAHWARLQAALTEQQLTPPPLAARPRRGAEDADALAREASTLRAILQERLRAAHGGPALLAQIQQGANGASGTPLAYLEAWVRVRHWLLSRLPADIADAADPRAALQRLHDRLSDLEERLRRQEHDLRGESENIARSIEVSIRRARAQVKRLNQNLAGLGFGNISGIQVTLHPEERMERVLRALRDGPAQGLLFQEDMPLDEALKALFERYAEGRTGGERILDYREYLRLQVEIQRAGSTVWELAIPTHLSTGEAIGVGAALMMVVLAEWEQDANLLHAKRHGGPLRFLFLDEANRLSEDNLGVLFDLCQVLDLQLLIAAPEVARAEGNTTYRLVRRPDVNGRQEVVVSGRRTRIAA